MPQPEQEARKGIDKLLTAAGWLVCDADKTNIHGARGVAIREFPLKSSHGFADYLLYIDGKAAGVIEAKKAGVTLTGVETQAAKYIQGLPDGLPRWANPLPFSYQSTGTETRFTNGLDPAPRSRPVFAFHKPETLADFLNVGWAPPTNAAAEAAATYNAGKIVLARLQHMPALKTEGLWPAQITAIHNLEHSLKENRPRALIQMGERRVKEPRTPAHGRAGRTTSGTGLRSDVTGSNKCIATTNLICHRKRRQCMGARKPGKSGAIVPMERISQSILLMRGHKVLLSTDLAEMYGVEPRVLVQAVKRNIERFPEDFMFQLNDQEFAYLKSQIVISSWGGLRRAAPYAFTEQGVAMLSSVLHSDRAIHVNIEIMRAFVRLRQMLASNVELARKLVALERKYDAQFKVVFDAIRELMIPPEPKKKRPIGFGPWEEK